MNKLRVILPKKWLTFDEIKDKVTFPTNQNKIEQLEKYIEVKEQECDDLQDRIDEAIKFIENYDWYYLELKKTLLDILKGEQK